MRLAIIYWKMIHSVGGIATHLNSLRTAAIRHGDTCDILMSDSQKSKKPCVFPERKWVAGGDTKIWIDGELPHHPANVRESLRWLDANYDAICFSKIAQHKTTAYPNPDFLPIYESKLPKVSLQPDGYWDMIEEWGRGCLPKLRAVFPVVDSYALPLREIGYSPLIVSGVPFNPVLGAVAKRNPTPLLVWPNQWKDIKGIGQFLKIVPLLSRDVSVELYSCGIRYYQLRTDPSWAAAVGEDKFKGFNGKGRAVYFGNVDLPQVSNAYQRAWFTVNLQGMRSKKTAYKRGSYNYTEVEALFYGACPILHSSTTQTILPRDCYLTVDSADEIPAVVAKAIASDFAINPERQAAAREFIIKTHLGSERYLDIRRQLV